MTRAQAEALAGEFRAAADEARRLCAEFSPGEVAAAPAPGAWSAADNIMHLAVASQLFVPRMTRTLGKLAEAGRRTEAPSRADWVGRVYAFWLEPPVRFRVRAPRAFVPPAGTGAADALRAFLDEQDRVVALVEQSAGLDLGARKVPSPVSRHLQYNVLSAFRVVVAHERRHLAQARQAAQAVRAAAARA